MKQADDVFADATNKFGLTGIVDREALTNGPLATVIADQMLKQELSLVAAGASEGERLRDQPRPPSTNSTHLPLQMHSLLCIAASTVPHQPVQLAASVVKLAWNAQRGSQRHVPESEGWTSGGLAESIRSPTSALRLPFRLPAGV